jgi:thiol-disulfide isomerase/thioredoxin
MSDEPKYRDARTEFWRRHFQIALPYDTYLSSADPIRAARWTSLQTKIPPLSDEQRARLSGFGRRMNVLVLSGIWCGDCVRQGPILYQIVRAGGPGIELRWIDRDTSAELAEELRILGGKRVPVVVFLSEDFYEAGRYGDRTLTAYRSKARRETGPACDAGIVPPSPEELAAEQEDWVAVFERMLYMLRLSPLLRERYRD